MSNTLAELGVVCRAQALALWSYNGEVLRLVCDWRLTQAVFDKMHLHWTDAAFELREGRRVTSADDELIFLPLMGRDYRLVGVLQYAGQLPDSAGRRSLLEEVTATLTAWLEDGPPAMDAETFTVPLPHVECRGGVEELERSFYTRLLQRYGWNVTLVAKILGLTRQTLHNRMNALGIARSSPSPKARCAG